MTPMQTILRVVNYITGGTVAETPHVIAYAYESGVNQCNPFSYTVRSNDPVARAIVAAVGGPDGTGPYLPYKIGLSHDNGTTFDVWKIIESPSRGLYVSESGYTIFRGYAVTGEDHATYHGCTLDQMLYGLPGSVPINGADTRLITSGLGFRWVKGLFQTHPIANTAYRPVIYPLLSTVQFDADVVADYLDSALKTILQQVSGLALDNDWAPLGSRGNFVEDSSDANLNLANIARSLCIGFVGTDPFLTFRANQDTSNAFYIPLLEDRNQPIEILDDRSTLVAQTILEGGNTDCGLPVGGVIADPVCVRTNHDSTSLAWDASLCIFACTDSAGNGGVYYWPHDGLAYPIGQAIPARSLAYYAPSHTLYCATDNGVMTHSADPLDTSPWLPLGGLRTKCTKVVLGDWGFAAGAGGFTGNAWRDASGEVVNDPANAAYFGGPGGIDGDSVISTGYVPSPVVVAEVSGGGSGNGLYVYPALSGDTSGATHGFASWSLLTSDSVTDWTYHALGDELLTVASNDPAAITITYYASSPGKSKIVHIDTPFGEGVTKLASLPNNYGTAVLTSLGADALYRLGLDGTWADLNSDATLLDSSDNPVLVNNVVYYGGPVVMGARTLTVYWFALTDSGVYFSCQPNGGNWQPPDSQSGIINENVLSFAIGSPQTLIDRVVNRMYACSSNGFWVSHNSGANFRSETREKLSLGAWFTALGRLCGVSPFLGNDVTSLGVIPRGGSSGTSGRNIGVSAPAPYTLSGDLLWVRALDQRCAWTYRLRHTTTVSPYNATTFGSVSEIGTDSDIGAATASGALATLHVRWGADRARLQRTTTLRARLVSPQQRLRALRATHKIALELDTTPVYSILANPMLFYVLKVQVNKGASDVYPLVTVTCGTVLRSSQPVTLQEYADGIGFTINRLQRLHAQRAK